MTTTKQSSRQTQHRPARDTAKGRELIQAKRTIKQLTREVSRLQKRLRQYEDKELEEESPGPALAETETPKGPAVDICPCGGVDWYELDLPGKKIRVCKICKAKKVISNAIRDAEEQNT